MSQTRYYRKYPRTNEKHNSQGEERIIDLSAAAAAGILILTFVKGVFWGFMLKRNFR